MRGKNLYIALWIILIISIIVVYIGVSTEKIPRDYFYNSDVLYLPALYRDLFSGYNLSGWKLTPSPYFFPDMVIFFILNVITGNYHSAIMLYGVIQSVLFILALLHLSKTTFKSRPIIQFLILFVGIIFFLLLSTGKYHVFMPILQSAHHFGATLILLVSLALVVQILGCRPGNSKMFLYYVMLFILSALTVASETLYLVQFLLPIILSLLLLLILSMISIRPMLSLGLTLILSIPVGVSLNRTLVRFTKIRFSLTIDKAMTSKALRVILDWSRNLWAIHTILCIVWIAFVAGSILLLTLSVKKLIKTQVKTIEHSKFLLIISFFIFSICSNVTIALLTGLAHPRYFIPALIIPMFFGWPLLASGYKRLFSIIDTRYTLYSMGLIIFLLALWLNIFPQFKHIFSLATLSEYYPGFVKCLDENTRQRNLQNGMAEYWDAKLVTMLSKTNLFVVQVKQLYHNTQVAHHWINNLNWYNNDFEFVITQESINDVLRLDEKHIVRRFGKPADVFSCDSKKILVYNRKEDVNFQKQFRVIPFFAKFENPQDEFDFYASHFFSLTGETIGLSRIAAEESDESGYLMMSPELSLPGGEYYFEIHYYAKNNTAGRVGTWSILLQSSSQDSKLKFALQAGKVISQGEITKEGKNIISGTFSLSETTKTDIKIYYEGRGLLIVNKVKIRKTG